MKPTFDDDLEQGHFLSGLWEWWPTAAVFAFIPFGVVTRTMVLVHGARAYAPSAPLRLLFLLFVHVFVTCPLIGYPLVQALQNKKGLGTGRLLAAIALLSAPFLSLAYFLGDYRFAWQYADAVLAIVPAVAIALLQYRRVRSTTGFIFILAITSFIPLFLIGDVLGPWPTYFSYETANTWVYLSRGVTAALGVWMASMAEARERAIRVRS